MVSPNRTLCPLFSLVVVGCRYVHYSTGGGELSIAVCGSHISAEQIAGAIAEISQIYEVLYYVVSCTCVWERCFVSNSISMLPTVC